MVAHARKSAPEKSARSGRKSATECVSVAEAVESVVGCKWSLRVLAMVRAGVSRPGAMTRECPGISTKVLNERLTKMLRFGLLDRTVYAETPPRVEYRLTAYGKRFVRLLDEIAALQRSVESASGRAARDGVDPRGFAAGDATRAARAARRA